MTERLTTIPETERRLSDSVDFYKLPMGEVALAYHPEAEVTFTFKNRETDRPLAAYLDIPALQERFATIREKGFTPEEIAFFAGMKAQDGEARFDEQYLDFLADLTLTDVNVGIDPRTKDIAISAKGQWANVSLWETVVMSEVNEQYYQNYIEANGLDINEIWAEGDRRLDEKIAKLKDRPDIKFADFGTRRRFSAAWHEHVIQRLAKDLPNSFIGTSNPFFAYKYGLPPIGTLAHEMTMVYAGIEDARTGRPLDGQQQLLTDWREHFGADFSIVLTDTFTTDLFLNDFTVEQADAWNGVRHDSGDPVEFAEKVSLFYADKGIDPNTKSLIFSDGLNVDKIIMLADRFKDRFKKTNGWGGDLMNDVGLPSNNIVMKATNVNGIDTVKLSDTEGKHTGPSAQVNRYIAMKQARMMVGAALQEMTA